MFFAPRVSKNAKTPTIWRFSATTRPREKLQGQQQQQQQQQQYRGFWSVRRQTLRRFLSRRLFKNWLNTAKMTPCGALHTSPTSSTMQRQQAFEFGFFCFIVFCDFAVVTHFAPIRFYKQTTLYTYRNLCTEQLLCADTLIQGLCADNLLHADAFTHRGFYAEKFYTQKFLYTDALRKDAFTRINKGTQALLHTEPFTQKNLCTEQLLHKKTFTQENFDTEKLAHTDCTKKFLHTETFIYTQKLHPEQLLHAETFPHISLYAQKSLCTAVFTQALLPTDAFTQKNKLRTETSAHSTLLQSFTQPTFTRRGFACPAWSPTFRVPPLKWHLHASHGSKHCLADNGRHILSNYVRTVSNPSCSFV